MHKIKMLCVVSHPLEINKQVYFHALANISGKSALLIVNDDKFLSHWSHWLSSEDIKKSI